MIGKRLRKKVVQTKQKKGLKMLTNKEIDTLIDALTAWESKDLAGNLIGCLFSAMLTKDDPVAKEKARIREEAETQKSEREKAERKEQSLLLKAKLIQIKQSNLVNEATEITAT